MTTTKIWTYAFIDFDLIRDDPQSADGVLPVRCWVSRIKAEETLQAALDDEMRDIFEDNPDEMPSIRVDDLKWNDDHYADMKRWSCFIEEVNSFLYLYEMEIEL